jgi:hypothetical protein
MSFTKLTYVMSARMANGVLVYFSQSSLTKQNKRTRVFLKS